MNITILILFLHLNQNDIIYLVFVSQNYNIIFYNIIDEKKVIEIFTHDENIIELKYQYDE